MKRKTFSVLAALLLLACICLTGCGLGRTDAADPEQPDHYSGDGGTYGKLNDDLDADRNDLDEELRDDMDRLGNDIKDGAKDVKNGVEDVLDGGRKA